MPGILQCTKTQSSTLQHKGASQLTCLPSMHIFAHSCQIQAESSEGLHLALPQGK